jgi:hypothetical protein
MTFISVLFICVFFVIGTAGARVNYRLPGEVMPRTPSPRRVANKSLGRALKAAYKTLARSYTRAASGDAYFARPARRQLWRVVDSVSRRRTGRENPTLQRAVKDLQRFRAEFGGYRNTGDQRLQLRMLVGYSAERPGIKTLLQRAFDAAGMGQVSTFRDNAPN